MADLPLSQSPTAFQVEAFPESSNESSRISWVLGVLLIMGSWCTVLAAGALAPVLPQIRDAFADASHLDLKIGFMATMPSLAVALFAIPIGRMADRVGLTQVMLIGLAAFGIAGVLPYRLNSLEVILATRFIVGIGEAAVMITSTALIGLLFKGSRRTRWLGLQVAVGNFLGIAVLLGGGVLGLWGWRAPFLIYSFALFLMIPCLFMLPRPRVARPIESGVAGSTLHSGLRLLLFESCFLICITSMALFTVIVQAGFLLEERGATDSALRGLGMATAACGIAVGATVSGMITRWSTSLKVRIAFLLMSCGQVAMMMADGLAATAGMAAIAGFGSGFVIPALLSRLLGRVPSDRLGGATGLWIAATFAGQFANPPLFILLKDIGGSQAVAIGLMGGICLLVTAMLPLLMRAERSVNR